MKYLAVCAIMKNEPSIKDWIDYHILAGVEHFVLYDNGCEIALTRLLAPYIAEGVVTVVDWLFDKGQMSAYANCLERFRDAFSWIAFIDADECLVPKTGDDLRVFLLDYEEFAALGVHWVVFGSSGHVSRPAGAFIEHYTRALDKSMTLKMIVRPARTVAALTPHDFEFAPGERCVNEDRVPVAGGQSYHVSKTIQINHYFFRSQQDYCEKAERGLATALAGRDAYSMEEFYAQLDAACFVDETILKYLPKLTIFGKKDPKLICRLATEFSELSIDSYLEAGLRHMENGKLARAGEVLGLMQCYHGGTAACQLMLAAYHRLRGDTDAALSAAKRAIAAEPGPQTYLELLRATRLSGDHETCRHIARFIRKALAEAGPLTQEWELLLTSE